jgi:magnesium transporter
MRIADGVGLDDPITKHLRRDFATIRSDQRIDEALTSLRKADLPAKILYFYVVDADGKLFGVVSTRALLTSRASVRVGSIAEKNVIALPSSSTVSDACDFFILYRFLAFPVIDENEKLIGTVDITLFADEMAELSEASDKTFSQDIFQMIGVRIEQARATGIRRRFVTRFPWLIANIAGGIGCAIIAGMYEAVIERFVALALFMPVVLALSESIGMQTATIMLSQMHGRLPGNFAANLGREFKTAVLLGFAAGFPVAVIAFFWKGGIVVAAVILAGIAIAMAVSCLLGTIMPAIVRGFGRDPKIAAGPLVLAVGDVCTLIIYFSLASLLLSRAVA